VLRCAAAIRVAAKVMFRKACDLAIKFTFPVVISTKTVGGECRCGLGGVGVAFVQNCTS
jgi:hypothetical protein